jgi:maleate cis-trans isomerase
VPRREARRARRIPEGCSRLRAEDRAARRGRRRRHQPVGRAAVHGAGLSRRAAADPGLGEEVQDADLHPGTTTLDALRALAVTRFVGATYFRGDINKIYARYFADAGFDVLDMAGMDVDFDKVQELSSREVYRFVKRVFLANATAQAIYMLGPAWRTLDIVEKLEDDLGVPVIHAVPAQCWDIQRHLNVRQPVFGFGQLIAEMPSPP